MAFVETFNGFKVKRKTEWTANGQQYVRYSSDVNSWQRTGAFGWYNITPVVARCLFDQGFKLWDDCHVEP